MAIMASQGWVTWGIFGAVVAGLVAGVVIGQGTELFTSDEYKATKGIAAQTQQGPATTIIDGIAVGMYSTWIPVVTIVIGIIAAFGFLRRIYGIFQGCIRNRICCCWNAFHTGNHPGYRCIWTHC